MGQIKPVFVTRYIIKGTVEKRIMKIRESVWVARPCILRIGWREGRRATRSDADSERSKTALVNASLAGGAAKDKAASLADIKKIFGLDEDDSEDEVY